MKPIKFDRDETKAIVAEILAAQNHAELVMRPGNTAENE